MFDVKISWPKIIVGYVVIFLAFMVGTVITGNWNNMQTGVYTNHSGIFGPGVIVSENNSTTIALDSAGVFTGKKDFVGQAVSITVFYDTDQPATAGGLQFQFSSDGTNWDRIISVTPTTDFAHDGDYGGAHTLAVVSTYFRIKYTNDTVAQTHFRLQTIYNPSDARKPEINSSYEIGKYEDAQLFRMASSPAYELNAELIKYKKVIRRFGSNDTVGTSFEDVWSFGGTYPFPKTAQYFRVKSGGNAADSIAGTGARTIEITYLDSIWNIAIDTLVLKGASIGDSTKTKGWRVWEIHVLDVGTYGGSNTGKINVENSDSSKVVAHIQAGLGRSLMSQFAVPARKTAYVTIVSSTVTRAKSADVIFYQRPNAGDTSAPFSGKSVVSRRLDVNGQFLANTEAWVKLTEKTDFWASAKKITGSGDAGVSTLYSILLVDN